MDRLLQHNLDTESHQDSLDMTGCRVIMVLIQVVVQAMEVVVVVQVCSINKLLVGIRL